MSGTAKDPMNDRDRPVLDRHGRSALAVFAVTVFVLAVTGHHRAAVFAVVGVVGGFAAAVWAVLRLDRGRTGGRRGPPSLRVIRSGSATISLLAAVAWVNRARAAGGAEEVTARPGTDLAAPVSVSMVEQMLVLLSTCPPSQAAEIVSLWGTGSAPPPAGRAKRQGAQR